MPHLLVIALFGRLAVAVPATQPRQLAVAEPGRCTGAVYARGADGLPRDAIAGATLQWHSADGRTFVTTTDAAGRYTISLPAGRYFLAATHPGHRPYRDRRRGVRVRAGRTVVVNCLLPVAEGAATQAESGGGMGGLAGVVQREMSDGRLSEPIAGATVVAVGPDGRQWKARTGPDGRFVLALPTGIYRLRGQAVGYHPDDSGSRRFRVEAGLRRRVRVGLKPLAPRPTTRPHAPSTRRHWPTSDARQ